MAAMPAETSSSAAGTIPVVAAAATPFAEPTVEAIFAKSVAAAETISGAAIRNDICTSDPRGESGSGPAPKLAGTNRAYPLIQAKMAVLKEPFSQLGAHRGGITARF
jgi:hypothetical protein